MTRKVKAVVIGAGVNGLVAAAALARAGGDVTVIERGSAPCGMMALGLFARGPHPAALETLGLKAAALGPAISTVALCPSGRHVMVEGAEARFADGSAHPGAERWRVLSHRLDRFATALAPLLTGAPPPMRLRAEGLPGLLRFALRLRLLGARDMRELLRIGLSNAADLAADALPEGPLPGLLAFDSVLGSRAGPMAPGTVVPLLRRRAPLRRMDGLAARLAAASEGKGGRLRIGAGVARILFEDDRARGVLLDDGERVEADLVISSLGAAPTLALAGAEQFDIEAQRRIRTIRAVGAAARVDLYLAAPPRIPGLDPAHHGARLVLAPSVQAVERAFDPVKYGRLPALPVMEGRIDGARLSLTVQCVPYGAPHDRIVAASLAALEMVAPGIGGEIRQAEALSPADIEAMTGAPGGHWHHGEIALDQFLTLRPANGMARYAMGPPGLFLCGAGAHPGGDVTGLPGLNGARAALEAMR